MFFDTEQRQEISTELPNVVFRQAVSQDFFEISGLWVLESVVIHECARSNLAFLLKKAQKWTSDVATDHKYSIYKFECFFLIKC